MTAIVEEYTRVFDPAVEDNSVNGFEYTQWQVSNGVISSSTQQFEIQTMDDNWILPSRAFLQVQGYVESSGTAVEDYWQAGLAVAGNQNIGMVNGATSLFSRATISANGTVLEELNNLPVACQVKNLLTMSDDYKRSSGSSQLFYPDSGGGGTDRWEFTADNASTRVATYNAGFRERHLACLSAVADTKKLVSFQIPLSTMFGFCKVDSGRMIKGLRLKLQLTRETNENIFMSDAGTHAVSGATRFIFTNVSLWLPRLSLSPSVLSAVETGLAQGLPIIQPYEALQCYRSGSYATAGAQSWRVVSQTTRPTKIYVVFRHNARDNSKTQNNLVFDHIDLRQIQLKINGVSHPQDAIQCNYVGEDAEDWSRAYYQHLLVEGKSLHLDDGSLINYADFRALYPIYCFDLSKMDASVFGLSTDITINWTAQMVGGAPYHGFAVVSSSREAKFHSTTFGSTIVSL